MKPNPADLAQPTIDKDLIRSTITSMVKTTKKCCVEMIMKDNHTKGGNPQNVIDLYKIAKEAAESI